MLRTAFVVALLALVPTARGLAVYDNTQMRVGAGYPLLAVGQNDGPEAGNQVTLAGHARQIESVGLYLRIGGAGVASFDVCARLYANNGPNGAPGNMLWDSGVSTRVIDSGADIFYSWPVPRVLVPDTVTLTVRLTARTGNPAAITAPAYSPPTRGNAVPGVWVLGIDGAWQLVATADPPLGMRVLAAPNPCDANCDGQVDFFDIDPFLLALFNPAQYATTYSDCDARSADADVDGEVNFFDIDPFLDCLFSGGFAAVTGEVTDGTNPRADARVTLFSAGLGFFRETRTDSDGRYRIAVPVPATLQLGMAARDRAYIEQSVVVSAGTTVRDFVLPPETEPGRWDIIGNTAPEFLDATDIGVLLRDGRIFYCHDTIDPILFDPQTGLKTFPPGSGLAGGCMNGTLLSGGRVLFAGGQEGDEPGNFRLAVRWVRTFDPQLNQWTQLADLQQPNGRWYPGLARLNDGSLLAMGGGTRPDAARTDTCERFDLVSQTWNFTGSMLNPTEFPPCALLYTGEVLATWYPPQLYNPAAGTWRATGNFVQPNRQWPGHSDHSLIVLADGRALAVGTLGHSNNFMGEIYNPASETWSVTANPGLLRFQTEVVQLPDGRVLAAGGEAKEPNPPVANVLGVVKWCDLYDADANTWRRVADMNWFREYHAVTLLLPDGRVATTGGTRIKFQVGPTSADIEAFVPPYLFRGVRPQITSVSATTPSRGESLSLSIFHATRLTSVVLMGAQTTTHWVDGGVPRRVVLPVQQTGMTATFTLPTDLNILPLGHYMVFAMVDDIPSRAAIVEVR